MYTFVLQMDTSSMGNLDRTLVIASTPSNIVILVLFVVIQACLNYRYEFLIYTFSISCLEILGGDGLPFLPPSARL